MSDFQNLLSLPLEQQIGQLLFIGLSGKELDIETRVLLDEIQPGGVVMFARNISAPVQLRALLDAVRATLPVAPLIGIDQEGGLVDRLRRIFPPMPAARVIRQHGDLAGARALGRITGEVLRLLGFNISFAPVMDIMTEDRDLLSNGLYSRSFGRSPGEVLGYTTTYLRGLHSAGCHGCVKHFPGIGAGEVDSHDTIPVIKLSHDDLIAQDLAPYIEMFQRPDSHPRCLMVSHGGFPEIDLRRGIAGGIVQPASLSEEIVTKLLREELGYDGLVLTDDLEMGAIMKHFGIEEAALRAILAGNDMILVCARPDLIRQSYQALLTAAREGVLSADRLRASLARIAAFKSLSQPPLTFDLENFYKLAVEVERLNEKLEYVYGNQNGGAKR
ncbi:MAG: beta-N-acetylhexosaminidase [Pyrinomonadaceae bacterium]